MSKKFGLMGLETVESRYLDGRAALNCSDVTAAGIDEEVMKILKDCYKEAKKLLKENRALMDKLAAHLIEKETITGKEFMEIFRKEKGLPEPETKEEEKKAENRAYSGPSVLSWHLDGRKASHLPIPAYRCYGGGMVTVIITVDNSGRVVDARIQEETSSDDRCLRDFAIRAARQSRFSIKQDAPARQRGDIIYQFLAQ